MKIWNTEIVSFSFNTEIHRIQRAESIELKIFLCTQLIGRRIYRNFQMNRPSTSGDIEDQKSPFIIKVRFYSALSKISIKNEPFNIF